SPVLRTDSRYRNSFVPGLHHDLARDLPAGEFDGRRTEHALAVRIAAHLVERHAVAALDAILDLVRHRPAANVIEIFSDRRVSLDLPRAVRRIKLIDDQQHSVVGVETAERRAIARFDGFT